MRREIQRDLSFVLDFKDWFSLIGTELIDLDNRPDISTETDFRISGKHLVHIAENLSIIEDWQKGILAILNEAIFEKNNMYCSYNIDKTYKKINFLKNTSLVYGLFATVTKQSGFVESNQWLSCPMR